MPAGRLAGVPWSMLPGLVGRPVTVARSASLWADAPAAGPLATAGLVAGPGVPRADQEVCECATAWGDRARVLTGPAATAAAVARLTAGVDLLHVAAHGHHADEHPLFSGLALVDGTWFGYDVEAAAAAAVAGWSLSACEVWPLDGPLGRGAGRPDRRVAARRRPLRDRGAGRRQRRPRRGHAPCPPPRPRRRPRAG